MKRPLTHNAGASCNKTDTAFTLVELLVAMAVMALLLVLMLQVTNGVLISSRTQNQQMESGAAARRALDVMAVDIQKAVTAGNSSILVPGGKRDSNLMVLPTARLRPSGTSAGAHRFLAVAYSTNTSNQIVRSYASVPFSELNPVANLPSYRFTNSGPLASGILALQILAIGDGTNAYAVTNYPSANWATNSYNGLTPGLGYSALVTPSSTFASTNSLSSLSNCTRALQVWIAAIDEKNYRLLTNSGRLTTAQSALSSTNPLFWRATVDAASIPAQTKSAIRILSKTIPLP